MRQALEGLKVVEVGNILAGPFCGTMRDVKEILAEFKDIADNPRKQLDKYLAQGKKVVGVFPVYTPEELVHEFV